MEYELQSLDMISTLPEDIIGNILSLMPIRDALRTSILSKRWQYCWRSMPKLAFTNDIIKVPSTTTSCWRHCSNLCKVFDAIYDVLFLHNGPAILEFNWSVRKLEVFSVFDHILIYLSRITNVKELIFIIQDGYYNLPVSFFSLQGLECIQIHNCGFEPPSTFNGFSRLRSIVFTNVKVSAEMLWRLLSNCPLVAEICLNGCQEDTDFAEGGNEFTFIDLFQCVPLIETLDISKYYMKYLCAGGMKHKFSTSLAHLKYLYLDVCLMEHDEISSILGMIRSSPLLVKIVFMMYDNEKLHVQQTPNNFLDLEDYSDLKLDHLETLEIEMFSNKPLEMEFVKLIMAKSPVLRKVLLELNNNVSVDEELKMLRDLVRLPFSRASPSARLIIERP